MKTIEEEFAELTALDEKRTSGSYTHLYGETENIVTTVDDPFIVVCEAPKAVNPNADADVAFLAALPRAMSLLRRLIEERAAGWIPIGTLPKDFDGLVGKFSDGCFRWCKAFTLPTGQLMAETKHPTHYFQVPEINAMEDQQPPEEQKR